MPDYIYQLRPIGFVRTHGGQTQLELLGDFAPGLDGLQGFSHVVVVWWCHLLDEEDARRVVTMEKPYTQGPDQIGIFATRSPVRPNPIAITPVQLLAVDPEKGLLHVGDLDAEDGTPILDLKPYTPSVDRVRDVRTPEWCSHWPAWAEDSADFDWGAEFNFPSGTST